MSARLHRRIQLAVSGVIAFALLLSAPHGYASPADEISATRKNAVKASARLDDLAATLELRNEEFLQVSEDLSTTRAQISETERNLDLALADENAASQQLSQRAVSMYRDGPLGFLDVFVGASDYQELITRLEFMRLVGQSDAALLIRVREARKRIDATQRTLETRRVELVALRERSGEKKSEVEQALEEQRAYLSSVNSRLKRLIADEKKRREEEAARQAARIAARLSGSSSPRGREFVASALGEPHPEAVTIARRYVNKTPYLWGGTTPRGFDCSGLVQYSYNRVGIPIPRTSRLQYRIGAFIPPDRLDLLAPGDLVFFGYGGNPGAVHHVGMYTGDGKMIHAPQAGQLVSQSSLLERISSRGDYVGACRP